MKKRKSDPYCLSERADSAIASVKVKKGPFADLVVRYGRVELSDVENPDGTKNFKFEYDIIENPHDYVADEAMFNCLGDILVDIIVSDKKEKKRLKWLGIFQRK